MGRHQIDTPLLDFMQRDGTQCQVPGAGVITVELLSQIDTIAKINMTDLANRLSGSPVDASKGITTVRQNIRSNLPFIWIEYQIGNAMTGMYVRNANTQSPAVIVGIRVGDEIARFPAFVAHLKLDQDGNLASPSLSLSPVMPESEWPSFEMMMKMSAVTMPILFVAMAGLTGTQGQQP